MTTNSPGGLPKGWSSVRFGDVVERVSETGIPTEEESKRYIGLEHMESGDLQIRAWGSEVAITNPKTRVCAGDVLFARRNTHLRRAAIAPFDTYYSPDGYAFRSSSPALLQSFLLAVVSADAFMDFAVRHSSGTHSKRVKWTQLQEYQFALPPLEEQKRIVEVMESAEQARACYRAVSLAGSSLRAALLNRLDSEGTRVPLGSVASIQRGSSYKSEDYTAEGNGKPFLTLKSVSRAGHYAPDGLKWVRDDFDPSRSAEPGDLFFANTDLTPGKLLIGAPFFFPGEESDAAPAFSMDLSKVEVIHSSVSAEFLYFALSASRIRQEMRLLSGGSTVAHLRLTSVPQIEISVPTPSRQKELLVQLRGIDRAMTAAFAAEQAVSRLSRRAFDVLGGGQEVV